MSYSKSSYAKSLGISNSELEKRAKNAGFSTTEEYANLAGSSGKTPADTQNEFLTRYRGAIAAQPTTTDIYNRLSSTYGLEPLKQTSANLGAAVEAVPENVNLRAKSFGMSAPRIQQRIAGEYGKLAPAYQKAVTQQQTAEGNVATQLQLEEAQKAQQLVPFTTEAGMISQRLAQEATNYTNTQSNQLTLLLDKLTREGNVSAAEMAQINALALLEREYYLKDKYKVSNEETFS